MLTSAATNNEYFHIYLRGDGGGFQPPHP